MRSVSIFVLGGLVFARPQAAAAGVGVDRFEPIREDQLLGGQGVDISTGWVPANSAIQVSFHLHVGDTVVAEMPGGALYDWDAQEIHFEGDDGAGIFAIDVGVLLDARVRFDLLGNPYESELIGPYDLLIDGETAFRPYLLPGNDDRPALISDVTEPAEVYNYSLVDAIIASGDFVVEAAFDVDVQLQCTSIDLEPIPGTPVAVTEELAAQALPAPVDGADLQGQATLRCNTVATLIVLLYPSVRVTIGLEEFELTPFELPVPVLADAENPFNFDALPLLFEAPERPSSTSDDSAGSGDTTTGTTGGGAATGTGASTDPVAETDGDTDTDAAADGPFDDDGRGCSTDHGTTGGWWMVVFALGVGGPRRRLA